MKRSVLAIAIATVLLGSTAFSQQPLQEGDSQAETRSRDTNRSDERFLKDFAQINAAAVYTGTTAEWKAEYAEVKAFATHVVDTHSQTIGKIAAVAAQTHIDVKAKPDFMQKAKSAMLDINVGASFDRAYMKATVNDYQKVIEMLEREITDGQDANIKQLASESLSDVQENLKMAQDLLAIVSDEENASRSLARSDSSGGGKLAARR
jgi:putative membrane protein